MKKLSSRKLSVFVHVLHGYTYAEIGRKYNLSIGRIGEIFHSVFSRINRMKNHDILQLHNLLGWNNIRDIKYIRQYKDFWLCQMSRYLKL